MDWASWGVLIVVSLSSGTAGALLYSRHDAVLRAAGLRWRRLQRHLLALRRARKRRRPPLAAARARPASDDTLVLIPDG
ncbi:MAG: hypothetical protein QME94_12840, partial [Anaerolineae bacterium]|nr:hypothetical protein [Anaerolineae bacterium]